MKAKARKNKRVHRLSEIPPLPGVYLVRNTANGDSYVGATVNMRQRINVHFTNAKFGYGTNLFRESFAGVGEKAFSACVLEQCLIADLAEFEQKWIRILEPTLNESADIYRISPMAGKKRAPSPKPFRRPKPTSECSKCRGIFVHDHPGQSECACCRKIQGDYFRLVVDPETDLVFGQKVSA